MQAAPQLLNEWDRSRFRAITCLAIVLMMPGGCLVEHCELYPEHCLTATEGSSDTSGTTSGVPESSLELSFSQVKQFDFNWDMVLGAEYYRLFERADVGQGFVQVGGNIVGESVSLKVPLHFRANASYELHACNGEDGCQESASADVASNLAEAIGYFKASNTSSQAWFGNHVSLSVYGNTLAVSAIYESGSGTDNPASGGGAAYVFTNDSEVWSQRAYLRATYPDALDWFGHSLALSGDGNTVAVGARGEDGSSMGIGGNETDNSADSAGAVYVFVQSGDIWSKQAYIKASNTEAYDWFGSSVALSADGSTLAVGAENKDSSGAAYMFVRNDGVWSQQAYVKGSNTEAYDRFGSSMALSDDGDTLAVGAYEEDSSAVGNQADNSASDAGAVYVLVRSGGAWSQQAYLKASNVDPADHFGWSMALSEDGDTLAVGARNESSSATGIDGDTDDSAPGSGAVYLFVRNDGAWSQQAYIKASNTHTNDHFGYSVALSDDGNTLAVSSLLEDSSATGIGGDQADDSSVSAGAVYVFVRNDGVWSQHAYVKASNTESEDNFGCGVALSGDSNTLAVGAYGEAGSALGIGGNQTGNSSYEAGAVYLY